MLIAYRLGVEVQDSKLKEVRCMQKSALYEDQKLWFLNQYAKIKSFLLGTAH